MTRSCGRTRRRRWPPRRRLLHPPPRARNSDSLCITGNNVQNISNENAVWLPLTITDRFRCR
jgi:hypothetical protein